MRTKRTSAKKPESNEYFEVIERADYDAEFERPNGKIERRSLFYCKCKSCGRYCDLMPHYIRTRKSCGRGCSNYYPGPRSKYAPGDERLSDIARENGMKYATLRSRVRKMSLEEALAMPVGVPGTYRRTEETRRKLSETLRQKAKGKHHEHSSN